MEVFKRQLLPCTDTAENVPQPFLRIDVVEFSHLQQRIHRGGAFTIAIDIYEMLILPALETPRCPGGA